jgi:hypothetical protein
MYDAVTPTNIPVTAQMVAGYLLPSSYAWSQTSWDRFPNSVHVRIAVRASTRDGHVIDCETGDATPAGAAAWAHQRRADGYPYPTVYCSVSAQAAVIAAFNAIREPLPLWWLAHYNNLDQLPGGPGVVADQYADPGPYDRSIVADFWPGVDGDDMVAWIDPIPFNGTTAPVQDCIANADLYAGRAMNAVLDPTTGLAALHAQVAALAGALSADEAALIAAIQAQPTGGQVDVNALAVPLAAALIPLLPPDVTPVQVGAAVVAALETQLAK